MEKVVYQEAKRLTRKWEIAQRSVADLGFYGDNGEFISWAGKPLRGEKWVFDRQFLRKDDDFLDRVGDITWPLYQANKRIANIYERSERALAENRMLRRRLKKQESSYIPKRKMTGGWTEETEKTKEGVLYVAESMLAYNVFKVGKTNTGRQTERLRELQTATPMKFVYELEDPNVVDLEKRVQELLDPYNLRNEAALENYVGQELFRCSLDTIMRAIGDCTK